MRIAETDLFCGNFCIEMKILNPIGCVLCLTATDITDITQANQVHVLQKKRIIMGWINPETFCMEQFDN